jgi:hypothetical protein
VASPVNDSFTALSGEPIYGGRQYIPAFDSVDILNTDSAPPYSNANQVMVFQLHGSGGANTTTGRQYLAQVSGKMAYGGYGTYQFSTVRVTTSQFMLRPTDLYGNVSGGSRRESAWMGFRNAPTADVALIAQRRLEALMNWADQNLTAIEQRNKRCLTGGSMGGWGTLTFGSRRKNLFAAIYPDRPRPRYCATSGNIAVADWGTGFQNVAVGSAPHFTAADGGALVTQVQDVIAYLSNTSNSLPWIGWCVGRQDGYTLFQDHVDMVAAMRTAKRGFAFYWNNGDHTTGSQMAQITQSYPFGLFTIGVGYPLFTSHSDDLDPATDLVGGINIGLTFRNVVESASAWSCEVTSVLGARTVDVEPKSDIFTAAVTKANVTIPAANTWVPVSFSA